MYKSKQAKSVKNSGVKSTASNKPASITTAVVAVRDYTRNIAAEKAKMGYNKGEELVQRYVQEEVKGKVEELINDINMKPQVVDDEENGYMAEEFNEEECAEILDDIEEYEHEHPEFIDYKAKIDERRVELENEERIELEKAVKKIKSIEVDTEGAMGEKVTKDTNGTTRVNATGKMTVIESYGPTFVTTKKENAHFSGEHVLQERLLAATGAKIKTGSVVEYTEYEKIVKPNTTNKVFKDHPVMYQQITGEFEMVGNEFILEIDGEYYYIKTDQNVLITSKVTAFFFKIFTSDSKFWASLKGKSKGYLIKSEDMEFTSGIVEDTLMLNQGVNFRNSVRSVELVESEEPIVYVNQNVLLEGLQGRMYHGEEVTKDPRNIEYIGGKITKEEYVVRMKEGVPEFKVETNSDVSNMDIDRLKKFMEKDEK